MEKEKPIKRHPALKPLSRQHHFGLLFSWKLRKGFSEKTSIERIRKFAEWFFVNEIQPHFNAEEKYIFPIFGKDNELVKRALKEHRRIKRLFKDDKTPKNPFINWRKNCRRTSVLRSGYSLMKSSYTPLQNS